MLVRLTLLLALAVSAGFADGPPVVEGEWPRWRGPFNNGVARGAAPTSWSATENIAWKAYVPGRGFSSPVIWGDRIFLTTAVALGESASAGGGGRGPGGGAGAGVEQQLLVLAYDRRSGAEVWRHEAARAMPHEGYHRLYGSFASNSPVTDGETLIAFFGSRGVFAYDLAGKLLWKRTDLPQKHMRHAFGEGVAPVLSGDTLLLTFDDEGDDDFLLALDKNDGSEKWRASHEEASNWAPPLVIEHEGRMQAIASAPTLVRSYDLETGELIWECGGLGLNTIPAPVSDGEMVWVMSGFRAPNLLAIRLDGAEGDITDSDHVIWTNQRGNSYTPSPILADGILYFVTDRGMISAFDAKSGEAHYQQQRLPNPYTIKASPIAADGKIYQATENGDVVVIRMGPEYEVVEVNSIKDEFFVASPAVANGMIFLRGTNTLYAIE